MSAVNELAGGVAHDFNNILSIIMGNLELLELTVDAGADADTYVATALDASERAAELTQRLLNFSRQGKTETEATNLGEVVAGTEGLLSKALTASINIKTHAPEDLWMVDINPGDAEDAIVNLCLNARDAMPGGGEVVIDVCNTGQRPDWLVAEGKSRAGAQEFVVLSVSDTGTGMSAPVLAHAIEPFFTTKEVGKGTGLGLSMVREFAKRSGGFLHIESELGEGTIVRIALPRFQGHAEAQQAAQELKSAAPPGHELLLIVDDEEAILEVSTSMLEVMGYRVVAASGPAEAMEALRNISDIAMMITDIVMPGGVNGYQLAADARTLRPDLPICFSTGFAGPESQARLGDEMAELGDIPVLVKPYGRKALADAIQTALDNRA